MTRVALTRVECEHCAAVYKITASWRLPQPMDLVVATMKAISAELPESVVDEALDPDQIGGVLPDHVHRCPTNTPDN